MVYGLGDPEFDPRQGQKSLLLQNVQTSYRGQSASYLIRTGGSFPVGKAAEAWTWPLTSIDYGG
jgi:hypothetical protein